jgi:Neuraminidase (sialidase)
MENSIMITDRTSIDNFRILALVKGLKLEILGLKRGRGKSCYQILKDEFGLKGSKQKIYDQLNQVLEDWKKENNM